MEATLAAGELQATFLPDCGMVCSSLRHRGEELLVAPHGLEAYARGERQAGIPLLHPWANRLGGDDYRVGDVAVDLRGQAVLRDPSGLPLHGLLTGSRLWRLLDAGPTSVAAELDFGARPELMAAFPFAHVIRLEATLDPGALRIAATVTPTGDRAVPIAFGFHPFLTLPGLPRAAFGLELPAMERLVLDERGIPTGATEPQAALTEPLGERTFDDGYVSLTHAATLAVHGGGRRIAVVWGAGFAAAQVFAPPGKDLIAFEPMTAPTDALRSGRGLRTVAPGTSFTARFAVEVA